MNGAEGTPLRNDPSVCLLVAANDEVRTIAGVVAGSLAFVDAAVVVDDGSTDGTAEAARESGAEVLRHARRLGKGAALRTGLDTVLSRSYDHVLFMDADGQHDPADIPLFISALQLTPPPDVVLGSRIRPETRRAFPGARYVTNLFGRFVLSRITGFEIQDSQCGFRLVRSDLLRMLVLESSGFEIETEMLIKLCAADIHLVTVPVSIRYHPGRSHYRSVADTYRVCMATLRY